MARILWHSCAPWSPSGYGTQTAIWAQELQRMGHEVFISSFWGLTGSATQWNGITVLPGFGGSYCSPSLGQHARHLNPDLVITLGDVWVLDPNVFRDLPAAHWIPCDCRPMSLADRAFLDQVNPQVMAMSRFGEQRYRDAGFDPLYVPHGVDFSIFQPPEDKAAIRKECGLDPDAFVIGVNAANNDAIRKAPSEMMLAFARFARDHPDAVLSMHTGVKQDGGQDLECLAESLGITDKIRVVDQYRYGAGMVELPDLNTWYGALDVLLASTYGEGFGIPIVEAKACGVPVITTKCSSMEELNSGRLSRWTASHSGTGFTGAGGSGRASKAWCRPWSRHGTTVALLTG